MEDKEEATAVSAIPINMCVPGSEAIFPAPTSAIVVVQAKDDQVVEPDQDHHPDQQEVPVQSIINNMPNNNKKKSYGPYQCPRCSLICNSSQAFAGHMRGHHNSTRLGLYKPVLFKPPKKPSSNNSNKVMPLPPPSIWPVKTLPSKPPVAPPKPTLPASSSPTTPSSVVKPTTTATATEMAKVVGMAATMANRSPLPRDPSQSMMRYLLGDNIEAHKAMIPVSDYSPSIGAAVETTIAGAGAGVGAGGGANNINRIMNLKTVAAMLLKQRRALAFLHACNIEEAARLVFIEQEMTKAIAMASSSININAPHELVFQPNLPMPAMVKQQVDYHDHHRQQQHLGLDLHIDLSDDDQRRVHLEFAEKINGEKQNNIMNITPADGHGEEELDLSLRL